ncbi:MAG: isopentenyl phosphate kinase [Chloroflexota bacterium]|nr:isopentenyl phosphate kinase [Chloroflexota bacterium]
MTEQSNLIFIKLGGSLITDKNKPMTARKGVIRRLTQELAEFRQAQPERRILVGHGSGSFGHTVASRYNTQNGVRTDEEWLGFAEVWAAARQLNQIVMSSFAEAGLPTISFPPSAGMITVEKQIQSWDLAPIRQALAHGLIPVVQGDVIFDSALGGTIFSTERVFQHLAQALHPAQILLAGADPGVYRDPAAPEDIIPTITPDTYPAIRSTLSGSQSPDVTGGMLAKVELMLALVEADLGLSVRIFSGAPSGALSQALTGEQIGTSLHA